METYGERLQAAMAFRGKDRKAIAKAIGRSVQAVGDVLLGKTRAFTSENNSMAAGFLEISPDWLATGDGPMIPQLGANVSQVANMTDSAESGIRVPVLANSASMGPGDALHSEDVVTGALTLSPQWISDTLRPSRAEALRFIHAYGDSMIPTFNSGDVLLVDTGVAEARIDGIYVLGAHQRLFIKRVRQRMDGGYEVSSDNPAHKTVDTLNGDQSVTVLGRVLWAWNGKRV